ncbi:unnamed protein product [Triticum turgidum subsp. durum]|uniref:BHLH domain-containing protein n=3 Tax=Triticum TaxID=4564 RepID=A0A9R1A403_TRITD|nr:unnamed protein product [Triticum turgidum subsp. durum]
MRAGFNGPDAIVMTSGAVAYYYRLTQVCQLAATSEEMQGDPGYGYGGYGAGYGYGYGGGYGGGYDMAGYGNGAGGAYYTNDRYPAAAAPAYEDPLAGRRQHDFPAPLTGLEFQPSDTCPKNYVIFDQTYDRSRVMYHPSLANNFGSSGGYDQQHCNNGGYDQNYVGKSTYYGGDQDGGECSIRQKEDTDEIDALMSSGDGDEEDDVLSTGRTPACRGGGSPDSTCSSGYVVSVSPTGNAAGAGGGGERKKERMKKMMKTLKGIIPGGDRMDTPAVLDEAVRYLKSLKVEVKKLGVRGSRS